MDTLKDAIRLKKGVTLRFPKGGIRGDHVLPLPPVQINRLDKAQVEGRRVQIRLSARQMAKHVSYTGGFIISPARVLPFVALMSQQESDRMRFIVWKLWDLKLQIYMIEKECAQLTDVIGHVILLMLDLYLEIIISRSLFTCVCMHLYSR